MNKKNFKQSKATDGIDVEFSRELADHNDLEANARANAADARQNASQPKNKVHHNLILFKRDLLPNKINRETSLGLFSIFCIMSQSKQRIYMSITMITNIKPTW